MIFISTTLLANIDCFSQNLSLNDLVRIKKGSVSQANDLLIERGWEFDTSSVNFIRFTLNRDRNLAQGWLSIQKFSYEDDKPNISSVSYEFFEHNSFNFIREKCVSLGMKKVDAGANPGSYSTTYEGATLDAILYQIREEGDEFPRYKVLMLDKFID